MTVYFAEKTPITIPHLSRRALKRKGGRAITIFLYLKNRLSLRCKPSTGMRKRREGKKGDRQQPISAGKT